MEQPIVSRFRPYAPGTALVLVLSILATACTTPISVKRVDPKSVRRSLTSNVLASGELSLSTVTLLKRLGADEHYKREPKEVLSVLHELFTGSLKRESLEGSTALVALAELSFEHASATNDARYYLSSVAYAWAYLFPRRSELRPERTDPRLRLAVDLYNRGLTLAFEDEDTHEARFTPGLHETSFGQLDIRLDEGDLQWGNRRLTSLAPVAALEVRGLRNRYRWRGIGAPLAARTEPLTSRRAFDDYALGNRVPVSAVLIFDDFNGQLDSGVLEGQLHLRGAYSSDSIEIGGVSVPLEMEPSSALAFGLTENNPWARELKGLLQGDLPILGDGLYRLEPYVLGKIPIVLVHGTASSMARWADIVNDLTNDRLIRTRYQFWLFTYNTGSPIAYSAWRLRRAIRNMVARLDPGRNDTALSQIVVAGHSQGGLLTKLTAVDSGMEFWELVSDVPIDSMDLDPASREILAGSLFVKPVPEVKRVVFISTPHRGSYLAEFGIARWMSRLIRTPANLLRAAGDVVSQDENASGIRRVDRIDGAIGNMSPSSVFLGKLLEIPVVSGVRSHSIISVKGGKAGPEESDGIVKYKSAHIDGVDSELIVDSGHSSQSHPVVIAELRRILLEHIGQNPPTVRQLFPD
jgi:triacylglycerol esterase/lipase EstA (alpha/beta hydrolase family)